MFFTKQLQKEGFTNIDALDASQEMLNVASKKDIYKELICAFVVKDQALPIENSKLLMYLLSNYVTPYVVHPCHMMPSFTRGMRKLLKNVAIVYIKYFMTTFRQIFQTSKNGDRGNEFACYTWHPRYSL